MSVLDSPQPATISWRRRHPVAWASGLMGAAQLTDALAMLGQVTVAAHVLSRADYGLLGLALAWSFLASSFLDFRVWEVMTIVIPRLQAQGRVKKASALVAGCFLLELAGGLVTSLILAATATIVAQIYAKTPEATLLFLLLSLQPLLMSADEPSRTLLKLAGQFPRLAWWRGLSGLGQFALVTCALVASPTAEHAAAAISLSWIARVAVLALLTRSALRRLRLFPLAASARPLILETLMEQRSLLASTMLSSIAGRLSNRADLVLLGWLTSPVIVAPYELARRLTSQFSLLIGPIEQVVFPRLSRMSVNAPAERSRFLRSLTLGLGAIVIPLVIVGIWLCPFVIPWVFGERLQSAVEPTRILLLAYLPTTFFWMRPFLASQLRNRFLTVVGFTTVFVQIALGWALVPLWQTSGSAWSVVIAQWFWSCMLGIQCARVGISSSSVESLPPGLSPRESFASNRFPEQS